MDSSPTPVCVTVAHFLLFFALLSAPREAMDNIRGVILNNARQRQRDDQNLEIEGNALLTPREHLRIPLCIGVPSSGAHRAARFLGGGGGEYRKCEREGQRDEREF